MPRVDRNIIAKREKLLANAAQERFGIPARQVGAADAIPEKGIAGDDEPLALAEERDVPWSMAGYVEHLDRIIAKVDGASFFDELLRLGGRLARHTVHLSLPWSSPQQRKVGPVQFGQQAEGLMGPRATENMIDMGMGQHKTRGSNAVIAEPGLQFAFFGSIPAAGIDEDALLTIVDHIGVLLERIEGE